jgi:hypothetical protein
MEGVVNAVLSSVTLGETLCQQISQLQRETKFRAEPQRRREGSDLFYTFPAILNSSSAWKRGSRRIQQRLDSRLRGNDGKGGSFPRVSAALRETALLLFIISFA